MQGGPPARPERHRDLRGNARRPSSQSTDPRLQQHYAPDDDTRRPSVASHVTKSQANLDKDWHVEDSDMLQLYGLTSLAPTEWQEGDSSDVALFGESKPDGTTPSTAPGFVGTGGGKSDEPDPLGLLRNGVLASNPDLPAEVRPAVLLHSKSFDPKLFLSSVHPNATFRDLTVGRERLKESLEQRSGALKLLVEAEWDRFVAVKAATESELVRDFKAQDVIDANDTALKAVYEDMKNGGPLEPGSEHGVKDVRQTLSQAAEKADAVYHPILDARTKAERLRSTLGVFERSKFFFNLPTILGEAVEAGKHEVALQAYKKGRFILASRPEQLLGLPIATTPQQQQQQKRIYDKVWGQVEKIIGDLRTTLGKRLRDTKRGLDEIEKTIEILLELDPSDDPVWIFFDTQHRHILQLLRTSAEASSSRIRIAMDQHGEETTDEVTSATDLRKCVASLEALDGEIIRESAAGREVWKLIFDLVRNLNEVILQTLPSFWKVAKGYMEGKYQKKNATPSVGSGKRSPTQCRVMSQDIVALYVTLLSTFFTLSSSTKPSPDPNADPNATPPLPPFVPPTANAAANCHWLLKTLSELNECVNELVSLELAGEANQSLRELVSSTRWRFEEAICSSWVRDAKVFYRLETWQPDSDDVSITAFLRQITSFQRFCAISAYRIAGGSEERANALMGPSTSSQAARARQDTDLPTDFVRKVQSAYLDALYAFLDGLVHVAFSDPDSIFSQDANRSLRRNALVTTDDGRPKEVDVRSVDTRILLTVSNLTHLRDVTIPKLVNQFQSAFKIDMKAEVQMLMDVTDQLDKILFDDYVKRKSSDVAKIIRKGVLGGTVDWYEAAKPTEVHPFIYDALLSLVLVHAQVSATAKPLVARTLGSMVEELAHVALDAFSKVERFGMGGMLQATLEIEFMHQTLSQHVSPQADTTLQSIYKTISQSYYRRPSPDSAAELQTELEGLKRTLVASRRATALQFLCFRASSGKSKGEGKVPTGADAVPTDQATSAGSSK
ncbi:Exocyst complex component S5 [Microbotryomycetes sp. JL221]|nr:Exocyst complex component S5 [Microbotryomycetes sp. JL221]